MLEEGMHSIFMQRKVKADGQAKPKREVRLVTPSDRFLGRRPSG